MRACRLHVAGALSQTVVAMIGLTPLGELPVWAVFLAGVLLYLYCLVLILSFRRLLQAVRECRAAFAALIGTADGSASGSSSTASAGPQDRAMDGPTDPSHNRTL